VDLRYWNDEIDNVDECGVDEGSGLANLVDDDDDDDDVLFLNVL